MSIEHQEVVIPIDLYIFGRNWVSSVCI